MSLASDLVGLAKQKILDMQQGGPGQHQQVREEFKKLISLQPGGLNLVSRLSIDVADFADKIEPHRANLRPWITVYAAAAGITAPWNSILSLWAWQEVPSNTVIDQKVVDAIDSLMTGYARTISAHP